MLLNNGVLATLIWIVSKKNSLSKDYSEDLMVWRANLLFVSPSMESVISFYFLQIARRLTPFGVKPYAKNSCRFWES